MHLHQHLSGNLATFPHTTSRHEKAWFCLSAVAGCTGHTAAQHTTPAHRHHPYPVRAFCTPYRVSTYPYVHNTADDI